MIFNPVYAHNEIPKGYYKSHFVKRWLKLSERKNQLGRAL